MTALGSGIYSPSGPLNFTYNHTGGEELIVAKVPILSASTEAKPRLGVGRGEVGLVEDLVRASNKSHDKRAPQIVVAFCDGTETAHTAYLCAKNLIRPNSKDCLTVATIESDCHGHDAKHQPAAIRHRYARFQCFCYSIACVSTM